MEAERKEQKGYSLLGKRSTRLLILIDGIHNIMPLLVFRRIVNLSQWCLEHAYNFYISHTQLHVGDFHFLWECLRVVFSIFWGIPSQQGSLSSLRSVAHRLNVDKKVKVELGAVMAISIIAFINSTKLFMLLSYTFLW